MFVFDHGTLGYQTTPSPIGDGWLEVTIGDDEVEIVLVATLAKLTALGLTIAALVASEMAK